MLFSIDDDWLPYGPIFDEFPGRSDHTFEFTVCACGERNGTMISTTSRHRNLSPIMMCARCGTLRSNPHFTKATAEAYYKHVFGSVKRGGLSAKEHQELGRQRSVREFLLPHRDEFSTVLDFGGGSGGRTIDLLNDGKQLSLIEVEGHYSAAAYDAGISRHEDGARYDLIVISHVIEHLLDPKAEVRDVIDRYGKPGGLVLIATPWIDFIKPRKWLKLFHIAHKYYFNRDALVGVMLELGGAPIAQDDRDTVLFRITGQSNPDEAAARFDSGRRIAQALASRARRELLQRVPRQLVRRWRQQRPRVGAPIY